MYLKHIIENIYTCVTKLLQCGRLSQSLDAPAKWFGMFFQTAQLCCGCVANVQLSNLKFLKGQFYNG